MIPKLWAVDSLIQIHIAINFQILCPDRLFQSTEESFLGYTYIPGDHLFCSEYVCMPILTPEFLLSPTLKLLAFVGPQLCVLTLSLSLFSKWVNVYQFLDVTHNLYHRLYVFSGATSIIGMLIPKSMHFQKWPDFIIFYNYIIFCCNSIHCFSISNGTWTFSCLLDSCLFKGSCSVWRHATAFSNWWLSQIETRKWLHIRSLL